MIFIYHNNVTIIAVETADGKSIAFDAKLTIPEVLWVLAKEFLSEKLVWCRTNYKDNLNKEELNTLFHHDKLVLSYRPDDSSYFGDVLGYVDASLFVKVNKKVSFPTWQMSSAVGMIHASVLTKIKDSIPFDTDFDYYLCSLAKLCMPLGLLCYSEPKLFKELPIQCNENNATLATVFKFVKQHYKTRWIFLLLFNRFLYERKFSFFSFLFSFFYRKRNNDKINLDGVNVKSSKKVLNSRRIDVIIPTIGRKNYLYDVLCDLKQQTHLPETVIIVEQNPNKGSESELDYLTTEEWPFVIKHIFTHQAGACNARNLALNEVQSEWVFLADDDNRFESSLLEEVFVKMNQYGNRAVSTSYPQKNEFILNKKIMQSSNFGAGNSFIHSDFLKKIKFNKGFEFGYGEDNDFGIQLRNQGCDVLYLPEPEIVHLKAPMGGFRTKPVLQWQNDPIQPKPSPTVMLYQIKHNTKEQISGYKTILFFKYYKNQKIKKPFNYYINFQKQWKRSVFWANELNKKG